MEYLTIKYVHIATVVVTASLFALRLTFRVAGRPLSASMWRVAPHVNDTALLVTALAMVVQSGQYPFVQPWLTAKVVLLIAYIVLGSFAVRRSRSKTGIVLNGLAALLVLGAIVASALTRLPPFWGLISSV